MILKSTQKCHIEGYRDLTLHEPLIDYTKDIDVSKYVYFPLLGVNGQPLEIVKNVNDKVLVNDMITNRKDIYLPTYSSVSGEIKEIKKIYSPQMGRVVEHIVIENDFKYEQNNLFKAVDYESISKEDILELLKKSGIVGLGGAGFPTYLKYSTQAKITTIIINGIECEPYLTTDYYSMKENALAMIKGALILSKIVSAERIVIAVKKNKKDLIDIFKNHLNEYPFISLYLAKDEYPMGWERLLVSKIVKKEYDKLPSEVGAIVSNAQTSMSVAKLFLEGELLTRRIVTFAGEGFNRNSNVIVPIGVLTSEIIKKLGGYSLSEGVLIEGGPLSGRAAMSDEFAIMPTTGGILALNKNDFESEACLKCGKCIEKCPAFIQPIEIKQAFATKDVDRLISLQATKCVECGLCSFVCPSKIELADAVKRAKLYLKVLKSNKK